MNGFEDYKVFYFEKGTEKKAVGRIVAVTIRWDTEEELHEYQTEFFDEHFKLVPPIPERGDYEP